MGLRSVSGNHAWSGKRSRSLREGEDHFYGQPLSNHSQVVGEGNLDVKHQKRKLVKKIHESGIIMTPSCFVSAKDWHFYIEDGKLKSHLICYKTQSPVRMRTQSLQIVAASCRDQSLIMTRICQQSLPQHIYCVLRSGYFYFRPKIMQTIRLGTITEG